MMDGVTHDIRQAARALWRRPAFSLLVVGTLALGIGITTAIFSAVNGLILREPPFADPDRLVRISSERGEEAGGPLSVPELDDLRALPVIETAAMYTDQGMYNASGIGRPEELYATITTHDLFRVLGVQPLIGSTFPARLDRSRGFGLVISYGLWQRKFGGAADIVGRTMTLDGAPGYTIHGVMPAGFTFPTQSDLYRSSGIAADPKYYERRDARDRMVLARLTPGTTLAQARSAIDALAMRLEREFPASNAGLRFRVTPLRDLYAAHVKAFVWLLFGAVALILIVACANVTNLMLARSIADERNVAVQVALGMTRGRLLRLRFIESLLLAIPGGVGGLLLAAVGVQAVPALVPVVMPPWMSVRIDASVACFLVIVTLVATIAASITPAARRAGRDPFGLLKDGARGSSEGPAQRRLRDVLVVAEMALALVLLVGAGLLLQSVWRLQAIDLGYRTALTLTYRVELGWRAYGTLEKTTLFHRRVLERLAALPSVQQVTFDSNLPMSGKPRDPMAIRADGQGADESARNPFVHLHLVGPRYFEVMGMSILKGRAFDERDRDDTQPAVIVSQRLAERLWPGRDPIGARIQPQNTANAANQTSWLTVIGVASPVLHHELDGEPGFDVYRPFTQSSTAGPYYVIRTAGDPMVIAEAATRIIGETDPDQSFLDVQTYDRRVANRMWQRRLAGLLLSGFALLAVALAAVGLYGVLSYIVGQQTREMGVRLALGATAASVLGLVMWRGLRLAGAGLLVGIAAAFALARLVTSLLYEVSVVDPLAYLGGSVLLLLIAGAACYVPARRAARVDPLVALRTD
jgi:putative ABC transport system permease protein